MHVLVVQLDLKPERADDEVRRIAHFIGSQAVPAGVERFAIGRDGDAGEKVVLVEFWPSAEQAGSFMQTPVFRENQALLREAIAGPPTGNLYQVVATGDETSA